MAHPTTAARKSLEVARLKRMYRYRVRVRVRVNSTTIICLIARKSIVGMTMSVSLF